jgi:uncharacterized pyridoxal phosphate-dependent enzyme
MLNRRQILKMFSTLPLFGGIASLRLDRERKSSSYQRDFFTELGVRPFINGRGTITTLSGSLMPQEVSDAMNNASKKFVNLIELNEKAGQRIAEMLRCEDAHVTAGAASAIQLATAAAVTGTDREKIRTIPNLPGPQKEVIMPKGHRIYEQQFTACGVKLVEADGPREMEEAITENTVLAFYFNASPHKSISREKFVEIGKKFQVPTFNDAAADVPPKENLFKYTEMGFDLVTFSGGKAIRGPQSTGLLIGRKDLIEAARLNHSPFGSIGRGMKVNKEEVIGMMVALELYLAKDHEKEREMWEGWVEKIADTVRPIPSVEAEKYLPEVANHVPHLRITWNQNNVNISPPELRDRLSNGHPSIEVFGGGDTVELNVFMMRPEEVEITARRLKELLEEAIS